MPKYVEIYDTTDDNGKPVSGRGSSQMTVDGVPWPHKLAARPVVEDGPHGGYKTVTVTFFAETVGYSFTPLQRNEDGRVTDFTKSDPFLKDHPGWMTQ